MWTSVLLAVALRSAVQVSPTDFACYAPLLAPLPLPWHGCQPTTVPERAHLCLCVYAAAPHTIEDVDLPFPFDQPACLAATRMRQTLRAMWALRAAAC
jgi:hypothetical protein